MPPSHRAHHTLFLGIIYVQPRFSPPPLRRYDCRWIGSKGPYHYISHSFFLLFDLPDAKSGELSRELLRSSFEHVHDPCDRIEGASARSGRTQNILASRCTWTKKKKNCTSCTEGSSTPLPAMKSLRLRRDPPPSFACAGVREAGGGQFDHPLSGAFCTGKIF